MQTVHAPWNWLIAACLALILSAAKSLAHLQRWRSIQFIGMIAVSGATWGTTVVTKNMLSTRFRTAQPLIVSGAGGLIVGLYSCIWGRLFRTDIFTVSVTGVLFLVPVALSEGDAGLEVAKTDGGGRHPGGTLAIGMLQVVWGVCIGLLLGQSAVLGVTEWWRRRQGKPKSFRNIMHF